MQYKYIYITFVINKQRKTKLTTMKTLLEIEKQMIKVIKTQGMTLLNSRIDTLNCEIESKENIISHIKEEILNLEIDTEIETKILKIQLKQKRMFLEASILDLMLLEVQLNLLEQREHKF